MRTRLLLLALVAVLAVGMGATASTANALPAQQTTLSVPITPAQSGGALNGVFTITSFTVNSAGQLVANGVFNGTLTQGGVVTQLTNTAVSTIVGFANSQPPCKILDLTLGPLHLDLLGLVIDLNQVHLTITAVPGPGNLLGNLLCAIAHLLDQNPLGTAVQNHLAILNRLLSGQ
jgi:hypothetical protein